MQQLAWTSYLCFLATVFAISLVDINTDAANWVPTVGESYKLSPSSNITWGQFLSEASEDQGHLPRRKRNVLLSSGVRLCTRETIQQAITNHLKYYQLRVCQETVWEAFKIFWDRLPKQEEYRHWMSQCQAGTISAREVGTAFSQSEEHLALIHKKLQTGQKMSQSGTTTKELERTTSGAPITDIPTEVISDITGTVAPTTLAEVVSESIVEITAEAPEPTEATEAPSDVTLTEEDNEINNEIELEAAAVPGSPLLEQRVELSALLTGEQWSEELLDPTSNQYHTLTEQFTQKISAALQKLTELKSVTVLEFRPQVHDSGNEAVLVRYAVTLQTGGQEVSTKTLDFINLQSNMVEGSFSDSEKPTVVYSVTDLRAYINNTLFGETSAEKDQQAEGQPQQPGIIDEILITERPELPAEEAGDDLTKDSFLLDTSTSQGEVVGLNQDVILEEKTTPPAFAEQPSTGASEGDMMVQEELLLNGAVETQPSVISTTGSIPEPDIPDSELTSGSGAGEDDGKSGHDTENLKVLTEVSDGDYEISTISTITEYIDEDITSSASSTEIEDTHVPTEPSETVEETPSPDQKDEILTTVEIQELQDIPTEVPVVAEIEVEEATEDPFITEEDNVTTPPVTETEEKNTENIGEKEDLDLSTVMGEDSDELPADIDTSAVEITKEDLSKDEILLATTETLRPSVPSTPRSPEEESPFTIITTEITTEESEPTEPFNIIIPEQVLPDIIIRTEEGSGVTTVHQGSDQANFAMPTNPGRALMVFFSLRVTNMIFSDDLFNKSSPEYKALEQRFLELLVPYLQSNLSNFEKMEILNFRNGSIVVNSRMRFGKPVPRGVTTVVYLILEDFCNTAYQTMNLAIDKYSLDVESGDQADPCKFQACNEYAECTVNRWSGEAECVCNAGYFSVDGLPCQSICEVQPDFCMNDGKCDIIPGQGAICRCRVGENWWYRGEHCEEYVSEPLVVGIAIASVAGFLMVASGVIFFLARALRDQYDKEETEDPIRRGDSLPSLERATKYNPMYESDVTTGYNHYYQRYPEPPIHSSASAEASTDFSSEEIRHIYENSELTKEEIQDRIRIIELYAKDRQFADFVRQHQAALDIQRENSSS
ncbi:interphotoreceptor matrix proteoglycan 2 isoform X2 [Astyanax mexicanus]|uniref:interphotoreceptor matrix proteoglycan 2 isoform X2 n=1 Tax=Astyanax mexicanus TaxID=7994 RepID=UPI0020CAF10B|nr:interphotoreceptor matrix proteoglycan 2 isoform X2 [Astyanax mexicanus]